MTVTSNQPTLEAAIDTVADDPTEPDSATEPDEPVTFGEGFPDNGDAAAAQPPVRCFRRRRRPTAFTR